MCNKIKTSGIYAADDVFPDAFALSKDGKGTPKAYVATFPLSKVSVESNKNTLSDLCIVTKMIIG